MAFTPLFGGNLWLVEDIPAKPERNAANSFAQSRVRLHLTRSERAGRNPFSLAAPKNVFITKRKSRHWSRNCWRAGWVKLTGLGPIKIAFIDAAKWS